MSTTPTQQPEALLMAKALQEGALSPNLIQNEIAVRDRSAAELRRQHAEIARLGAGNEALRAELAKARTPLTDSEWLEYILRNGSKSDVHIATYEGVATTGARGMVIRLQHDANNLRKLVEAAHGIGEKT